MGAFADALILDALAAEAASSPLADLLLVGMQACATVRAANDLVGPDRVTLLHLDRAAGGVACGFGNRELFLGDAADLDRFSVVALNVGAAKSYRLLRDVVERLARHVAVDGVLLVAGPKQGGAEVAVRVLREAFETVALLTYRKGERIYRATNHRLAPATGEARSPNRSDSTAPEPPAIVTVELHGRQLCLAPDPRIFARGQLDPATQMLAEVFSIPPGAAVLDLGSGSGVLGILAALLEPSSHAWLVDSDPLAIEASRRNAALNGVANVTAVLSDVLSDLPGQTFDVILTNPPFHRGRRPDRSLAERFMTEAGRALRPGGSLYVVCNRFLRYEPVLALLLGSVREIAGDSRYKVLLARRRLRDRMLE